MNVKKTNPLVMVPLCFLFGIFDYYICDLVVYVLKLPLFCDTIFCLAMSFFANPFYGILVVVFDHLYDMAVSHSFVVYQLYMISAFIGCVIAFAFKQKFMKENDTLLIRMGNLFVLAIIMCLAMSISGGIISRICAFLNGDGTEYTYQTQFLELMFNGMFKYPLLDAILFRIPVNLIDRIVTVFGACGVYFLMKKIPIWKEDQ